MGKEAEKGTRPATAAGAGAAADLPERWSAPRKSELVMRLLRGEGLDAVSRDSQVPGHALEGWTRVFLEHGARGLKSRVEPEERESLERVRGPRAGAAAGAQWQARAEDRHADPALVTAIREILAASPFHGEGYRKVRARLAHRGLPVSGKRVLRLMRQHGLLAPRRLGPPNGDPAHAGTIVPDRPDVRWGTDATRFDTERKGWGWVFGAIDHHTDELLGWHVAKRGDRWAALEPIRQGVRQAFGGFAKDLARGLAIRCDWGSQYIADAWINEGRWLGITISPSSVGEPACNGVIERFNRTLKELCVYLHRFESLEQARAIIGAFIERYTHEWLIEPLGHRTPAQARADATRRAA